MGMFTILIILFFQYSVYKTQTISSIPTEYAAPNATTRIRVGLIVTEEKAGNMDFSTTGGAIPLALETMRRIHLVDNVEFEFLLNYSTCDEKTSIGGGVHLMGVEEVDVVIGPPCTTGIIPVAMLGSFYSTMQVGWGFANAQTLSDNKRFPYLSVITPNTLQLGYGLLEVLLLYKWSEVALLYKDDSYGICTSMMGDVRRALEDTSTTTVSVSIEYKLKITSNDKDMRDALAKIKKKARIVAVCFPDSAAKREFLIAISESNMISNDYVYILMDMKGYALGQSSVSNDISDSDTVKGGFTGIWVDTDNNNTDGKDEVAKKAALSVFALDLMNAGNTKFDPVTLRKEVFTRVRNYPFYCNTEQCKSNFEKFKGVGTLAGQLYDAFLFYGYVLNKTIAISPQDIRNRSIQMEVRENIEFEGLSGLVTLTPNGTRLPQFFLFGLDEQGNSKVYVNLTWAQYGDYMEAIPNYSNENTSIWISRGGKRPLDTPICGFDDNSCPLSPFEQNEPFIIGGCAAIVALITVTILGGLCLLRERRKESARIESEWRIAFAWLEDPKLRERKSQQSTNSLRSHRSITTQNTFGSQMESDDFSFFILRGENVVGWKHAIQTRIDKKEYKEFAMLRKMEHDNINRFLGMALDSTPIYSIWRFASRGSLEDVIAKRSLTMDAFFMFSLIRDMVEGLHYIHKSPLKYHGYLSSANCQIDDRWQLKISGFGLRNIKKMDKISKRRLLWRSPERLRSTEHEGSQEDDVYAFSIVASEVVTREGAFGIGEDEKESKIEDILYSIRKGGSIPMRPALDTPEDVELNQSMLHLIRDCWNEESRRRPDTQTLKTVMKSMNNGRKQNLMDHVFTIMESYAETLEKEVEDRMKELVEEKKKSDLLLYRMLPQQVADQLKLGQTVEPEMFDSVTVFFSDVVKFTNLAAQSTPIQIVSLLNELYSTFDTLIERYGVYKVETIGDGYLCVSGLPKRNGNEHVRQIAEMSLGFMTAIKSFRVPHLPNEQMNLRIGVHTGPCVTGVVGLTMPRYCLFGDTVNTASRMESNGRPGMIHLSSDSQVLLTLLGGYVTEPRGEVMIKGKGVMETFWLHGKIGDVVEYLQPD